MRKMEKRNPISKLPRKAKKINPAKQNFTQLSKILDKLEKALKKSSLKSKKHRYEDSDSDSE